MRPIQRASIGISPLRDAARSRMSGTAEVAGDFKDTLHSYISDVDGLQDTAESALNDVATGRADNLHRVVVATSEAELSFRLMMKVRNKLVEAYNQVMRMKE